MKNKVLYVGNFGSPKLDPALKDGMGYISKVDVNGKVLEKQWVPAAGGEKLHKPKGIWIQGDRLWVTDIDAVWIFDTKTKKGRKLPLPGVGFANDPAVMDGALYISDNRNDELVKVTPADFLDAKKEPVIKQMFKGAGVTVLIASIVLRIEDVFGNRCHGSAVVAARAHVGRVGTLHVGGTDEQNDRAHGLPDFQWGCNDFHALHDDIAVSARSAKIDKPGAVPVRARNALLGARDADRGAGQASGDKCCNGNALDDYEGFQGFHDQFP